MKWLMLLAVLASSPLGAVNFPENPDKESIGLWFHTEDMDGTSVQHFRSLTWIQGAGSRETRVGLLVTMPFWETLTLKSNVGFIRHAEYARETEDMSGRDYQADGRFADVQLLYYWGNK